MANCMSNSRIHEALISKVAAKTTTCKHVAFSPTVFWSSRSHIAFSLPLPVRLIKEEMNYYMAGVYFPHRYVSTYLLNICVCFSRNYSSLSSEGTLNQHISTINLCLIPYLIYFVFLWPHKITNLFTVSCQIDSGSILLLQLIRALPEKRCEPGPPFFSVQLPNESL